MRRTQEEAPPVATTSDGPRRITQSDGFRSVLGLLGLAGFSTATTAVGVWLAYRIELLALGTLGEPLGVRLILVGFVEEAFVRLVPLIATFYCWSYRRERLLSKTEGLVATVVSGVTVAGLELGLKLEYLSRVEALARFDSLVLPILFVHLPFALLAGRFAYALGEGVHGTDEVTIPRPSRRTTVLLVAGYLLLAIGHGAYNVLV